MIKNAIQARFYAKHRDRLCKEMRECAKNSRSQRNAYLRDWRKRKPELERGRRFRYRLKRYGLTVEQYYDIIEKQDGLCPICKIPLVLTEAHRGDSAVIDHKGRIVRGIPCNHCNQALGLFKDSVDIMIRAIEYVERTQ